MYILKNKWLNFHYFSYMFNSHYYHTTIITITIIIIIIIIIMLSLNLVGYMPRRHPTTGRAMKSCWLIWTWTQ
jgi:hypothetical protein